jgi:hypothetical protein
MGGAAPAELGRQLFDFGQIGANFAKFFRTADQRSLAPLLLRYGVVIGRLAARSAVIGDHRLFQITLFLQIVRQKLFDQRRKRPLIVGGSLVGGRFERGINSQIDLSGL